VTLISNDLSPSRDDLDLPRSVIDALVDMGKACTLAAEALHRATRRENAAHDASTAVAAGAPDTPWSRDVMWHVTWHLATCAVTHTEQLTVVYTIAATTYATYAAQVAAAVAEGREPAPPGGEPVLPSHVVSDPQLHTPLVNLPVTHPGERHTAVIGADLAAAHDALADLISGRFRAIDATEYDDPAAVAQRKRGSYDLVVELPR
jgi:hypothetical protein